MQRSNARSVGPRRRMTLEDASGLDMATTRRNRDKLDKPDGDIPLKRLDSDDDIKRIYHFGRKLGQGGFGVVYEATHIETQTKWAIKEICRPEAGSWKVKMLEHEINILKQVNHAHIIHLQEVYNTSKMIYLVTELCVGGELKQLLLQRNFFTEDETKHIICCLADAVDYLHKRNIVHRDLKLENILVKNSIVDNNDKINIKVTDFGLSVQTNGLGIDHILTESCGTLTYMAPEIMSGRGYSHWCDVWSMGVIIYWLLCGEPPFVSKTKSKLLEEITEKGLRFKQSVWATTSDAAKKVLTCLLDVDPSYRMSPSQLLENPWITGDTGVPSTPCNVLEMMRQHLEEKDSKMLSQACSCPPGVKLPADPGVKRCAGTGQKTAPCVRKVSKRPSTSCKTKSEAHKASTMAKSNTPKQQNERP
uniref:Serine/threonine kinase 33 n=1 Tax=Takifugu rubripes TaxID=31033 RepID=H2V5R4_TAKRU